MTTIRTICCRLPHFDHFRFCLGKLGDLIDFCQHPLCLCQIRLASLARPGFQIHHMIRIDHPPALVFLVPFRRPMATFLARLRKVGLVIPRGRLRRIARIRRWGLALFQLPPQRFIFRSQCFQLHLLCQDQIDQFVQAHLCQFVSGHHISIFSDYAIFA